MSTSVGGSSLPPYAAAVLREVRQAFGPAGGPPDLPPSITVSPDEIRVDVTERGAFDLVIIFRDATRPSCTFGFRWTDLLREREGGVGAASMVNILLANLEEVVTSGDSNFLERECPPGSVVWV